MSKQKNETPSFPLIRPEITITPTDEPVFEVDFREMAWWFALPVIGSRTLWAMYNPPDWRLDNFTDMRTLGPAVIHGIEGVEIDTQVHEFRDSVEKVIPWTFFERLTEDREQSLANITVQDGKRILFTLLDESFDQNWCNRARQIRQIGRFQQQSDGSLHQVSERLIPGETIEPMDVCEVTIGERSFTCLRVLSVDHTFSENNALIEAFLTHEGRTMLCRRYNGRLWALGTDWMDDPRKDLPWDERFPDHNRIVIDGVTFVHWYDCLSDRAVGIDTAALPAIEW